MPFLNEFRQLVQSCKEIYFILNRGQLVMYPFLKHLQLF